MDRLSTYAARESESEPPEDRKQTEEEATAKLLEKLRISKEEKKTEKKADDADSKQPNGDQVNGDKPSEPTSQETQQETAKEPEPSEAVENGETPISRKRGIPENVKLYEIFYDQVIHLVNAQRLHIQDTIALLVSLSNLAL